MTSFMRHHTIVAPPIFFQQTSGENDNYISNLESYPKNELIRYALYSQDGRLSSEVSYKALGYTDKTLDYTERTAI